MNNAAAYPESLHMVLAAYCATGFATAGVHSFFLLRNKGNRFHAAAIAVALSVGGTAAVLQLVSGDALARMVAITQPAKLASLEGQFNTETGAPLRIGGIPNMETRTTPYAIEIPDGLSVLAFHRLHAKVVGLDQVPRSDWPVVPLVHLSFQVMVGCGSTMIGVAFLGAFLAWRNPPYTANRWFVMVLVFAGPLGIIALEAGWMVTELGRQPWIIYHIMRTSQAVTSMPHVMRSFIALTGAYVILGIIVVWMLLRHVIASPTDLELEAAQRVEVGNAA